MIPQTHLNVYWIPPVGQVVADTVKPEGFLQEAWQAGKEEFKTVYGDPFQKAPVATSLKALGDVQAAQEAFSETEVYLSGTNNKNTINQTVIFLGGAGIILGIAAIWLFSILV